MKRFWTYFLIASGIVWSAASFIAPTLLAILLSIHFHNGWWCLLFLLYLVFIPLVAAFILWYDMDYDRRENNDENTR